MRTDRIRVARGAMVFLLLGVAPRLGSAGDRPPTPPKVLVLRSTRSPAGEEVLRGFRTTTQEAPQDLSIEVRDIGEDHAEVAGLDRVQVVLCIGDHASARALEATSRTTVIATLAPGARGGENVGGVRMEFPLEVQLDWLRRVLPRARRVGVLLERGDAFPIERAAALARTRGLTLVRQVAGDRRDVPRLLERLTDTVDVLWMTPSALLTTPQVAHGILLFSLRQRIPLVGLSRSWTDAGALYALDRDYVDVGRQAGEQVLAMLSRTHPAGPGMVPPRTARLYVNDKVLRRMKLRIGEDVLTERVRVP